MATVARIFTNRQKRALRMRAANDKGTHTKEEWTEMLNFFERTCCCCLGESDLLNVERDHIIPVSVGGSNSIRNLQPLCARCNASKGLNISDWRPQLADFLGKELPEIYTNPF